MQHLKKLILAAGIGLALSSNASAQFTTGSTTGNTTSTGSTGGTDGSASLSNLPTTSALDQTQGSQIGASALNQSNIFSKYYANPLYQGRAGAQSGEIPGGFGQALYPNASGGTSSFGGTGAGRTGTTGSSFTSTGSTGFGGTGSTGFGGTGSTGFGGTGSTGFGGTGSTGFGGTGGTGFGGTGGTGFGGAQGGRSAFTSTGTGGLAGMGRAGGFGGATQTSQVIPLPRSINYTAVVRFATPQLTPARVHTEVRTVLDRSISLSNPKGVEVLTDSAGLVLRGTVRDEDEARLIEGMVRLTPGVRNVRNELRFPTPTPQP